MAGITADLTVRLKALVDASFRTMQAETKGLRDVLSKPIPAPKFTGPKSSLADLSLAADNLDNLAQQMRGALEGPINQFREFETVMAQVKGQMGEDTSGLETLRAAAMRMGETTRFSAVEAAGGFKELTTQGFETQQQLNILPTVMRVAGAGMMDVATAAHLTGATLHQFGLTAADAESAMDIMQTAASSSATGLHEMGETLKYVGPIAHAAGVSLRDTSVLAGLLANSGIEASMAGTSLRGMFAGMAKTTPKAKKELAALGIQAKQFGQAVKDPVGFLTLLEEKMKAKNYDSDKVLHALGAMFGTEAATGVQVLLEKINQIGPDGKTSYQKLQAAQDHAAGSLKRYDAAIDETADGKLKKLQNQIANLGIEVGKSFTPALLDAGKALVPYLATTRDLVQDHPVLVSGLGKVALGFVSIVTPAALALRGLTAIKTAAETSTGALRALGLAGGSVKGTLGAIGVGWAAYELTTALDAWIGKTWELEGGLWSVHTAMKAARAQNEGDVENANGSITNADGSTQTAEQRKRWEGFMDFFTFGAYSGNTRANLNQSNASRNGYAPAPMNPATSPLIGGDQTVSPGQGFNAVTGQIEVLVSDDRVKVRTKGNVPLPVGRNP